MEQAEEKIKNKGWKSWIGSYIAVGLTWYYLSKFNANSGVYVEVIILIASLGVGFFYHKLKNKIKFGHEWIRIIVAYFILYFIASFAIGLAVLLPARLNLINQPGATEETAEVKAEYIKEWTATCEKDDNKKFCICIGEYLIRNYTFDEVQSMIKDIKAGNSPEGVKAATNYCTSK